MTTLLTTLEQGNFPSLAFLAFLLFLVGNAMSGGNAGVHKAAKVASAAAFLLFVLYGSTLASGIEDWIHIILRAILSAFLMFSASLIVFSVLAFLFSYTPKPRPGPRRIPAYQRGPVKTVSQPPPPPPPPPPTVQELHDAAVKLYERNCAMIDASPIPPEDKQSLKLNEADHLTATIQSLTGQE